MTNACNIQTQFFPPCKNENGQWSNVCRCGASDQVMQDKQCPNHQMDDGKTLKKIKIQWSAPKKLNWLFTIFIVSLNDRVIFLDESQY